MKQNNRIFNKTLQGLKKGLSTPTLSPEMVKFQSNPFIRIFRVLGGLSMLVILCGARGYLDIPGFIFIILYIISLLFFFLNIYFSYHRFKYIKTKLQGSDLDIRNSPLDRYASMLGRVILCAKVVCDSAPLIGLSLGLMIGADYFLKENGREAFLGPLIREGLNKILPKSDLDRWRDAYNEATNNLNEASLRDKIITDLINITSHLSEISSQDKKDLLKLLGELKTASSSDLESTKSQIIKFLEEEDSKKK